MPNEIEIRISGTNYTKGVLEAPREDMKKLGAQSRETSKDLVMQAAAGRALEKQMNDLEREAKQLAIAMRSINDETDKLKLKEKLDVNQSQLAQLRKLSKILGDVGSESGKSFMTSFNDVIKALPAQAKGALILTAVAAGVVLAPAIGSAVGAAVLGGIGTGGIIGGVMLASHDSRVQAAAEELASSMENVFEPIGAKFAGPVERSLQRFETAGAHLGATLEPSMEKLARLVDPLSENVANMVENLGPGLSKGIDNSLPVMRAAGEELEEIGAAFSDFIETITEDTDGATLALESISEVLQGQLKFWGAVISGAEKAFEWMVRTGNVSLRVMEMYTHMIPLVGEWVRKSREGNDELLNDLHDAKDASKDYEGELDNVIKKIEDEEAAIKALTTSFNDLFGIQMSIDEANIAYQEAIDKTTETLKENKKTLDINTETGRENKEQILNQISAIQDLRDANIQNGDTVAEADRKYQAQLNTLEKNLVKLGLNKNEVKNLIDAYRNVPKNVSTQVSAPGLATVLARMRELDRLFRASSGYLDYRAGERNPSGHAYGGAISSAQTGGNRGGLVTINEMGGELARMPDGSVVIPHGQSTQMLNNMIGNGGMGGTTKLEVVLPRATGIAFLDALIEGIRFKIDTEGQGDVQNYLGSAA